jgi:pimeloyl-ACP methyl ester carboxylesterase
MTDKKKPFSDYVVPLYINGLHGRMARVPAQSNKHREILFIYGHHSSLERCAGFADALSAYGTVTMPDLPGFGGMESFYKIGEKATLDNLADYLASFIKLRYKRRRITIVGMSFGFIVITRMLQKYPDISQKVDLTLSLVGFVHHEDFHLKRRYFNLFRYASPVLGLPPIAWFIQYILFRPILIRMCYGFFGDSNPKLQDADPEEKRRRIDFEIGLWRMNEVRTYMATTHAMFTLDLCKQQIALPVHHVSVGSDRYFDNNLVEQHMRVIYGDFTNYPSQLGSHAHTVVATAKDVAPLFPPKLRKLLAKT